MLGAKVLRLCCRPGSLSIPHCAAPCHPGGPGGSERGRVWWSLACHGSVHKAAQKPANVHCCILCYLGILVRTFAIVTDSICLLSTGVGTAPSSRDPLGRVRPILGLAHSFVHSSFSSVIGVPPVHRAGLEYPHKPSSSSAQADLVSSGTSEKNCWQGSKGRQDLDEALARRGSPVGVPGQG